jgi:hypothetical protein
MPSLPLAICTAICISNIAVCHHLQQITQTPVKQQSCNHHHSPANAKILCRPTTSPHTWRSQKMLEKFFTFLCNTNSLFLLSFLQHVQALHQIGVLYTFHFLVKVLPGCEGFSCTDANIIPVKLLE